MHTHTHTNRETKIESMVFDYFFIKDKTNKQTELILYKSKSYNLLCSITHVKSFDYIHMNDLPIANGLRFQNKMVFDCDELDTW